MSTTAPAPARVSPSDPASVLYVVPLDPWKGTYDVLSERSSRERAATGRIPLRAAWYRVVLSPSGQAECSCAAGVRGVPCKHVRACRSIAQRLSGLQSSARRAGLFAQWRQRVYGLILAARGAAGLSSPAWLSEQVP